MNPIKTLGLATLVTLFVASCTPGKHLVNHEQEQLTQEQKDSIECSTLKEEALSVCDDGISYTNLLGTTIESKMSPDTFYLLIDSLYIATLEDVKSYMVQDTGCSLSFYKDILSPLNKAYDHLEKMNINLSNIPELEEWNNSDDYQENTDFNPGDNCAVLNSNDSHPVIQFPCYDGQAVYYSIWNMTPSKVNSGMTTFGINLDDVNISKGTYILQYGLDETQEDNVLKFVK